MSREARRYQFVGNFLEKDSFKREEKEFYLNVKEAVMLGKANVCSLRSIAFWIFCPFLIMRGIYDIKSWTAVALTV